MNKKYLIITTLFIALIFISAPTCLVVAKELETIYPPIPLAPIITAASKLPAYIAYFFYVGIYVAGMLAAVSLVIAGIQYMLSAENPSNVSAATDRIKSSIIGLFLLLASVVIMNTINPQLTNMQLSPDIKEPSGLVLIGADGKKSAPMNSQDLSKEGNYDRIAWPKTVTDINGVSHDNCGDLYAYLIYFYENTGNSNVQGMAELTCGGEASLSGFKSYIAMPEVPALYVFDANDGCGPSSGSDQTPRDAYLGTSSNPSIPTYWKKSNIRFARIINGSDKSKGPFFGAIFFHDVDYYGSQYWHIDLPKNTAKSIGKNNCFGVSSRFMKWFGTTASLVNQSSVIIYQHAGYGEGGKPINAGKGVSLYKERIFDARKGSYCPNGPDAECIISGTYFAGIGDTPQSMKLSEAKISYPANSTLSLDEQKKCDNLATKGRLDCFQSINISGDFLVLLSVEQDNAQLGIEDNNNGQSAAEAFPSPTSPDGPSDLNTTTIQKKYGAQWIKIIPLAAPLFPK